ncbi:MAG: CPBP family intramembrane glutamic endopeptidase [Spirochaetia bacterium]
MHNTRILILFLLLISTTCNAIDLEEPFSPVNQSIVLETAVLYSTLLTNAANCEYVNKFTPLLPHIPIYNLGWQNGLIYSATQLSFLGGALLTSRSGVFPNEFMSTIFSSTYISMMTISPFVIQELHQSTDPDFLQVFTSFSYPFQYQTYQENLLISLTAASVPFVTTFYLFQNGHNESIESTIEFLLGVLKAGYLSLMTAVSEESTFSHVIYNGLRERMPHIPSTLISSVVFGLFHLPSDINQNISIYGVGMRFLGRAVLRIVLDSIYNSDGIGSAITYHFLWNIIMSVPLLGSARTEFNNNYDQEGIRGVRFNLDYKGDSVLIGIEVSY